VAQVVVVEAFPDFASPLLQLRGVDLDRRPATSTGQMVVVGVDDAPAIEGLTAIGHHDVDLAARNQSLQLGVDRGERDLAAVSHDEGVKVLGTHETLHPTEDSDDFTTLGGIPGGDHGPSLPSIELQLGMILSNIYGMVLKKTRATMLIVLTLVMVVVLGLFVRGALSGANRTSPVIVSGVSQWGALARQLASPDLKVVSLLTDPNADPHEHEATVSDAANVSRATYVVLNGAGYDSWLTQLTKLQGPQAHVLDVAQLMGVKSGQNPHLFYNPLAAITMVRHLSETLLAHPHSAGLVVRSNRLLEQLRAVQRRVEVIASRCSHVPVAATEDVASYLLADAGLRIVTPERLRLAVGNGVDPSIQDLATALAQFREHPAFLVDNVQTATPLTNELVSSATRFHVPVIRVTETMIGTNYVTWIDGVIGQMERALRSEGCLR
jgi:zinc/manganese transport system substrate-binding protein